MKPNFALSLSFEGIKLLHRAAGGWREVGEVSVSSPDLADELAVLRRTAVSLDPSGLRSKLIIPAEQIKYLTIETPGLSDAARRKAAETALFDATPYEIEELAYDISLDGPLTHVAAVARETLAEAEGFAQEHRFHPVSFVATPEHAPFLGEPFFGTTDAAKTLLGEGETVEPDGIAVVVVGQIEQPAVAAEKPAQPDVTQIPAVDSAAPPAADGKDTVKEADVPLAAAPVPDEIAQKQSQDAPKAAPPNDKLASATASPEPSAPEPEASRADTTAAPGPKAEAKPAPAPPEPTSSEAKDKKAAPATGPAVGAAPEPKKPTLVSARKVGQPKPESNAGQKSELGFSTVRSGTTPQTAPSLGGASRATPPPDSSSLTPPPVAADAVTAPDISKAGGFLSRRKPRTGAAAPMPAPAAPVVASGNEQQRMTVFGARSSDEIGGKPRFLGLIMTVILLILLAGVAAWAAVFLDDGIASLLRGNGGRAVASAPENQTSTPVIRLPADAPQNNAPDVDPAEIAALDPVLSAEDSAILDALQSPPTTPERPEITQSEAAARYAVSGIWPLAPETALAQPDIPAETAYRSSLDPVSTANDAIALPAPEGLNTDTLLAAVVSPPPFGQPANIDSRGLWVPSPDGVVTPEGYTLVAASPPLKPPQIATRGANVPAPAVATVSPLLDFRPKTRPGGLAENAERSQLGGVTRVELAVFRPALRPRSVQDRAQEARETELAAQQAALAAEQNRAAAAAAAAASAALALPPESQAVVSDATKYAVAQSRRPDTRPRNFSRIVKRAQRAAPVETRVAATASVAPRSVAPNIPSKASVARSATVKNAINLRKVNLIGVYGKPSSRRALVRLSNGRYKKVRVGDRIDGGQVSAIGDSELRYTKSGRNVVLKIPSS